MVDITTKINIIAQSINQSTDANKKFVAIQLDKYLSIQVNDDVDTLTNTATIVIPLKNTYFAKGELILENDNNQIYSINSKDNPYINIFAGYDNMLNEIFKGYIVDIEYVDNGIALHCEDEMSVLKRSKFLKNSFSSKLKKNTIRKNSTDFTNHKFTLAHLLLWMFEQEGLDTNYDIYCANLALGNLRIQEKLSPAEILEEIKNKYGIYVYFKYEYLAGKNGSLNRTTPRLYVGWKYWGGRSGIKVTDYLFDTEIGSTTKDGGSIRTFTDFSEVKVDDLTKLHKFADKMYPEIEGLYNRIVDDKLVWVKTDKDKLSVIGISNGTNNPPLVSLYPPDDNTLKKLQLKYKGDNNTTKEERESEKDSLDDFTIISANNPNTIKIAIPSLDLPTLNSLVKETYDNYEDSSFTGQVITFGSYPLSTLVSIGDIIVISIDNSYSNNAKITNEYSYYVDKVTRIINPKDGYRQVITLGNRYISQDIINEINTIVN